MEFENLYDTQSPHQEIDHYIQRGINIVETALKWIKLEMKTSILPTGSISQRKTYTTHSLQIEWTGKLAELVELGYALYSVGCINDGKIDLIRLLEYLSEVFNKEIKHAHQIYQSFKFRSGSRTLFLDQLVFALNTKMEKEENKTF